MKQTHILHAAIATLSGYQPVDPNAFRPDCAERRTVAQMEAENPDGFKFSGPGWYHFDKYTWLIVPAMVCDILAPSSKDPCPFVPWINEHEEPGGVTNKGDQVWYVYTYPALHLSHNRARDAIMYLATLPERSAVERSVEAPEDRQQDPLDVQPIIEVHVKPGSRVRVVLDETDGHFDVLHDWKGDNRIVVYADLPGNVMGDAGLIYVEDGSLDTTGTLNVDKDKGVGSNSGASTDESAAW